MGRNEQGKRKELERQKKCIEKDFHTRVTVFSGVARATNFSGTSADLGNRPEDKCVET